MIACHSLHTHILCLIEHSLKDQLLNILFSSPLQCVALGLMCCIIQTLLCKQIFYTSIFAACCSGTTVLPDFERICFHNACLSRVWEMKVCRKTEVRSTVWFQPPVGLFSSHGAFHAPCTSACSAAAKLTSETSTQPARRWEIQVCLWKRQKYHAVLLCFI